MQTYVLSGLHNFTFLNWAFKNSTIVIEKEILKERRGVDLCGRYWLSERLEDLAKIYQADIKVDNIPELGSEIFPSQNVPSIFQEEEKNQLKLLKWGFPNPFRSGTIINARAETVAEKNMFKEPFVSKRCIIPANAFFEWKKTENGKIKYKISLKEQSLFSMAAIYERFNSKDGIAYEAMVIITRNAVSELTDIHNRMPVILSPRDENIWLDNNITSRQQLFDILENINNWNYEVEEANY